MTGLAATEPAPEMAPPATPVKTHARRRPGRRVAKPAHSTLVAKPAHSSPVASPAHSTLVEEAALLRLANLAARAGHLEQARSAIARFDRDYPDSQLKLERDRIARAITAQQPSTQLPGQ